jgi:hypothetical protein
MQTKSSSGLPGPITVWSILSEFDHDEREDSGKMVHSYLCRRCRLELLLRQVTNQLGTPPDCPEKVPLVRSSSHEAR